MAPRGSAHSVSLNTTSVVACCSEIILLLVGRRTESFDNMGPVGVDARWDAFAPFQDYLVQSFPLTYVRGPSLKFR